MPGKSQKLFAAAIEKLEERRLLSTVVGLSGTNTLQIFDSAAPTQRIAQMNVKGLQRRELLLGIDFQPSTGQLFGVGDSGRLYTIDASNGRATVVNTGDTVFDPPIAGTAQGVAFNPVPNLLRVVNDLDLNARIDPATGAVVDFSPEIVQNQTDLALNYGETDANAGANPNVVALAYTPTADEDNDVATADTTTAYGLDSATNSLVRLGSVGGAPDSPNTGVLATVGALTVDILDEAGFAVDLDASGNPVGLATLATNARARSGLYTINLQTGAATLVGDVAGPNRPIRSLTVLPEGEQMLALHAKNRISTFDSNLPSLRQAQVQISGLARGERVLAIDARPANGVIYGVTNQNRLYSINAGTGAATAVGTASTEEIRLDRRAQGAGLDFNPVADAVRLVNLGQENVRFNVTTGQIVDFDTVAAGTQLDGPMVYASTDVNANSDPTVSGLAYSNNVAGATATTAYVIDTRTNTLASLGAVDGATSPNTGRLFTVGSLGVVAREPVSFDIVTDEANNNVGYAVFRTRGGGGNKPSLYQVDLATGAATLIGQLPRGVNPYSITASLTPVVASPTPPPTNGEGTGTDDGTGTGTDDGGGTPNPVVPPVVDNDDDNPATPILPPELDPNTQPAT